MYRMHAVPSPVPQPDSDAPRPDPARAVVDVSRRCGRRGHAIAYDLLRDPGDAEDAVQEALARLWVAYPRLRDQDAADAWFYRAVTNWCLKALRRRRVAWAVARWWPLRTAAPPAAPERGLLDALRRLPPRQQAAVVLHHAHGFSLLEVARALGVTPGTAKTHLARGMKRLRDQLGVQA